MKTKEFERVINWKEIMQEAVNYKYVVMYRDHYRGNGKGEYFDGNKMMEILNKCSYLFSNDDRPVYKVILTNDDVPKCIGQRKELIKIIDELMYEKYQIHIPGRPNCDGRKTRRTAPEAYAEFDRICKEGSELKRKITAEIGYYLKQMEDIPYYSTTLLYYV